MTYRAAIDHGADVGVVVVRHLLIVGSQEADGLVVIVLLLVVPRHRVVAVVRYVLPGRRAQEPQEGHLDDADGVALGVHVGKLRRERTLFKNEAQPSSFYTVIGREEGREGK